MTEWQSEKPTDKRLEEIAREYREMVGALGPTLADGPGAASAFYMSCSLGEIAAMAAELLDLRRLPSTPNVG